MIFNYFASGIIIIGLVVPVILQYTITYYDYVYSIIHISIYGLYLAVYLILQIAFSTANNIKMSKTDVAGTPRVNDHNACNVIIVGYRENQDYFKACLKSVVACHAQNTSVNKVILIIDGNDNEDMYMVDIFANITQGIHINLDQLPSETSLVPDLYRFSNDTFICVTQPHQGKRSALKTGFMWSILENNLLNKNLITVFCTDSDTVVDSQAFKFLFQPFNDPKVGAVAGNLSIYTKYNSIISFLSYLRYWFAFNMERAYQSFNSCVLCISGPIGMYRIEYLEKIIDKWYEQTFLGSKCTFGDDRHLTNLILNLGYRVLYHPLATASTECPPDIIRFFRQQTRWSKSSYREFIWSLRAIDKQSIFMSIDIVYLLIFPYMVMGYLLYVIWAGTYQQLQLYFIIVAFASVVKIMYGSISNKNPETIFYILYIIPYVAIIFPSKLWALLTISDTNWGSAFRKKSTTSASPVNMSFSSDVVFLSLWNLMLATGLCYQIYKLTHVPVAQIIPLLTIICVFAVLLIIMTCYVYIKNLQHRDIPKVDIP